MTGQRLAVFGLGRSGIAIARAAQKRGANVAVYDEKPLDESSPAVAELRNLNISISASFASEWSTSETDLVVTSPGVSKFHPKLLHAVKTGIPVISEIEFAYRIAQAPIVAITGTNGKSTTTVMTYLCLKAAGIEAVLCGNIYGSGYPEIPLTDAADVSTPNQVLVAEISSFQLEWIDTFKPKSAIVTNITDDHLNRYESFEDYAATKRRVFENMGDGDTIVWHEGDQLTDPPRKMGGLRVRGFGKCGSDAWTSETEMVVEEHRVPLDELPFSEYHNNLNAMAAVLLAQGASPESTVEDLLDGLKEFKGLEHRMERLGSKNEILFINNSMCTNPAAVVASSQGLKQRQHLLVGGVDKEMNFAALRDHLATTDHSVYLFGSSSYDINRQLDDRWPVFTTMREAFDAALREAKSSEVVMLAPGAASMDQFKDFRDRGEAFRAMAKEWLES